MTDNQETTGSGAGRIRLLLWLLVALALVAFASIFLLHAQPVRAPDPQPSAAGPSLGGPFTLVGGDGKPFSSSRLQGRPYALYFGYTRCGDTCPTTLQRLVRLRQAAGGPNALDIVFITIDPANDGPREVGQYASLFGAPIIGLTGTPAQIAAVKKQYGIYAEPEPSPDGKSMVMINHTATVLLFDRNGQFTGTITADEDNASATAKLKRLAEA